MHLANIRNRLSTHQSRIHARIEGSAALIVLAPAVAQAPLGRARWTMIRLVREYQLFKHTEIFDPVIRSGEEQQVATARRMRADCIAAGEHFETYVTRWSGQDLCAVWDEYRVAMRAMSGLLRSHLARECLNVEALLARTGPIRRAGTTAAKTAIFSQGQSPPIVRADSRGR